MSSESGSLADDGPQGGWNLANCLDLIAEVRADEEALIQGATRRSWRSVERRARNLAAWMLDRGASHQAKVALYTYNHPAFMESAYAAFKAALVPVNVNYRYREEELRYLLDNADAEIVVVHADFAPLLAKVQPDLPKLKGVLVVDTSAEAGALGLAEDFETVAETDRPAPEAPRSSDDLMFLYTGGTTGMPKGVMWRHGDLYLRFAGGAIATPPTSEDGLCAFVRDPARRLRTVIGPPLMHGTGWFTAMIAWLSGGAVILLENTGGFDANELWDAVESCRATSITIVGDSFAKPMLRALRERDSAPDLSTVKLMASSGVMWSEETKRGLLEYGPGMLLLDAFGSSEAIGMGLSVTSAAGTVKTAKFQLGERTRLFDENLQPIEIAPGARGMIGVGGAQPIGYYKDPEKSARTFVKLGDERFSVPGDWVQVNDDGATLTLLGRGSVCINTGGEKVFPEEVEEVVKRHPGVRDAVVVGVPDEKFGEAVTAVVSPSADGIDPDALRAFVKQHLAGYKAPRHVIVVDEVYRSPSGKADFKRTREAALAALGIET